MAHRTATVSHLAQALAAGDADTRSDRDLLARFVAHGDQAAFAVLAARHAGMVLGVCRRAVRRGTDAEDACQAVFLLLAQKAARVRWQSSVAGWLYAAARRVARNARVAAARRARREARAAVPEAVVPADAMTGRELAAVLDDELGRLAPRYRDSLVLCCLEGLTQDEAAARLGVPVETLRTRLRRGRARLAAALTARGCDLGIVLLAAAASAGGAMAAGLGKAIRAAASGSASPEAVELARAAAHPLLTPGKSVALAAAVAAAALGLGAALNPRPPAQPPKDTDPPAAEKPTAHAAFGAGRFRASAPVGDARYGPDGKRVVGYAGGTLYVWDADGSLVRTMETKVGGLPEPGWPYERDRAFAMHPKKPLVAFGGVRDDKTILQVWDFEAGKLVAETVSPCRGLRVLAWTPDGTRLLERTADRWDERGPSPGGGFQPDNKSRLVVRDAALTEVRRHELPRGKYGEDHTVLMHPLPNGKEVLHWQSGTDPTIFDWDSGKAVRPLGYKSTAAPSGLNVTPDGKTAIITCSELISLVDMSTGAIRHPLPILRGGWERPRPLFSPDGRTVYIFDFQPVAYDVATGQEKWRGMFPTVHNLAMRTCDVSPDGSTLLCMHGHRVARVDTATGTERDPPTGLSRPSGVTWSPDGRRLFTRAARHDRTWTAWDPATGQRLYDLLPTGYVSGNEWKMMPDLFFINGGKELVAGLEKSEKTERVGPKELLVFDAATGRPLRRLGDPLPKDRFQWATPIAVEPDGSSVVMQVYTVSGPPGLPGGGAAPAPDAFAEYTFHTTRWDPVRKASLREWLVTGNRLDPARRYAPYAVSLGAEHGDYSQREKKLQPARVRCYSLADGRLAHEWTTGFAGIDADRVQGGFLLTCGYESRWVTRGTSISFVAQPPFAYDVWEIPTGQGVRAFEAARQVTAVLGPGGQYVLRVRDDGAVEVHEPFVLRKAVATVSSPARPEQFEFAPDGGRVAVSLADTSVAIWDTAPWRAAIDAAVATAVPADLGPLWTDLSADAQTGVRAARLLAAAGAKGVALLKSRLSARQAPAADRVARLIADLDSPRFGVREKAEADLRGLGPQAEPFLHRALKANPSAEAAKRIDAVLATLAAHKLSPAEVRELRAVQALEWQGTAAARELMAEWAKGDPAAALTRAAKAAGR